MAYTFPMPRKQGFGPSIPNFLKFSAHDHRSLAHRARKRAVNVSAAVTRRAFVAALTLPTAKRAKVKAGRKANRLRLMFVAR